MQLPIIPSHQIGEPVSTKQVADLIAENTSIALDTYGGRVHVEWDPQAAITPLGQLPLFY
jgi:hypothetical protein